MLKSYYTFLILIFSISCTQETDIAYPFKEKEVVLVGILQPDSIIKVQLTYTSPLADTGHFEFIDNATVELLENDVHKELLSFQRDGLYQSAQVARAGSTYKVIVRISGMKTVEAHDSVPGVINGEACYAKRKDVHDGGDDAEVNVRVSNTGTATRYWLDLLVSDYTSDSSKTTLSKLFYLETRSISLDNFNAIYDTYFDFFQYTLYMRQNDESKNSTEFNVKIIGGGGHRFFRYENLSALTADQSLILNIYNCSTHYDRYLKSIILDFNNSQFVDFPNPLNGPVQIYTNVKNGYGIFAAYSLSQIAAEENKCN